MKPSETSKGLVLTGLDGANPLGFLAAVGTGITANKIWPHLRIHWQSVMGSWRPVLTGCEQDRERFLGQSLATLHDAQMTAFEIDGKLPFPAETLTKALKIATREASQENRRTCDLLAALGTEMYPEADGKKTMIFRDTKLRMVRSGDSAGQGLPVYAKTIRRTTTIDHLRRTLFEPWDYSDRGFSSLRWDPIEDQRYALRWRDPSKSGAHDGPGGMLGANSLAIEALQCFPVVWAATGAETTGFYRGQRRETFFTWPIWHAEIALDTVRALLTLPTLRNATTAREELEAMGISEVFRSQRIQQNQYYSNFAPSRPA